MEEKDKEEKKPRFTEECITCEKRVSLVNADHECKACSGKEIIRNSNFNGDI